MKAKTYREQVEIAGSVFQIDTERRRFKLRTDDGLRVTAPYDGETRDRVIEVLCNPEDRLIKVSGLGEFAADGTLKRVVKADRIIIAIARWERGEVDPNALTIGEMFDALIAEHPPEYWAKFPTDMVERHLAHRHGQCCQGE